MESKRLFYQNMKFMFIFLATVNFFILFTGSAVAQERDLYSDTWVASDALGRKMPDF